MDRFCSIELDQKWELKKLQASKNDTISDSF